MYCTALTHETSENKLQLLKSILNQDLVLEEMVGEKLEWKCLITTRLFHVMAPGNYRAHTNYIFSAVCKLK